MKHFIPFKNRITEDLIPDKFPFPFYYQPDKLAKIAVQELQEYLINQNDLEHNFGLDNSKEGLQIGKMFGVLVVEKTAGTLGYLAAYSGKLMGDNNDTSHFVPAVFDMFATASFYNKEKECLMLLADEIATLENNPELQKLQDEVTAHNLKTAKSLSIEKLKLQKRKEKRAKLKKNAKHLSTEALKKQQEQLAQENIQDNFYIRELTHYYKEQIAQKQTELDTLLAEIKVLKNKQVNTSQALSKRLMEQYQFLDSSKTQKSLLAIFQDKIPPAGAGECAAPKLLQYAFLHGLKIITMAEFWWGKPPASTIRKHGNFYPSCRGKCEPILGHMLGKTVMDDNPLLLNPAVTKKLEFIYEDEAIIVLNKPAEMLSVPGKTIQDSVQTRIQKDYPEALVAHRLDMATSGIMLIAKTTEIYKHLQSQFMNRTVKKRYVALLDGIIDKSKGEINLPLRVDLNDRPKQLVCYEYGKPTKTFWEVIAAENGKTRIYFYPYTGRTHQLRMHAAHPKGLNTAIVGDDLYGTKANRLHLHAEYIEFIHPTTDRKIKFKVVADF